MREARSYLLCFSFLIAVLAVVGGCASESEELWRITSPDSRVDAVFIQLGGGGATVGFSYKLFIVPRGAKPNTTGEPPVGGQDRQRKRGVVRAENIGNPL